ncbi:hypothetical protein ACFFX0_23345 [Citricoccus parietis]|uniref:Uncharacterized protein n=1 Tax=Citricoccus parietis TaxID=592307 RepID=A0ABV5G4U9_9MICC
MPEASRDALGAHCSHAGFVIRVEGLLRLLLGFRGRAGLHVDFLAVLAAPVIRVRAVDDKVVLGHGISPSQRRNRPVAPSA